MGIEYYLIFIPIILGCITIHEYAHAKVADMLGDPTARYAGRLTLNPIPHIDPFGLIALILFKIGWAKPVPVNPYNFQDPEKGMMMVGLAGPLSNFILAWILAVIVKTIPINSVFWIKMLYSAIFVNLALMVFNLLPIPPLDGSRIFTRYLPVDVQMNLERYGFVILIVVIFFPPTQALLFGVIQFFFNLLV
ncbi:MAG: site-2 protease family protein [Candidatus Saganbacteria bacterium]|nr:site-2 protease family protein [Candidatus Saganbacteria bacterium]